MARASQMQERLPPAPESSLTQCESLTGWPRDPRSISFLTSSAHARTLPLEVAGTRTSADGTFELRLRCTQEEAGTGEVRAAVFSLLGSFAETATYVRQRRVDPADASGGALLFEIVTGFLPSDTAFVPHGHAVRVSVSLT